MAMRHAATIGREAAIVAGPGIASHCRRRRNLKQNGGGAADFGVYIHGASRGAAAERRIRPGDVVACDVLLDRAA